MGRGEELASWPPGRLRGAGRGLESWPPGRLESARGARFNFGVYDSGGSKANQGSRKISPKSEKWKIKTGNKTGKITKKIEKCENLHKLQNFGKWEKLGGRIIQNWRVGERRLFERV